MTDGDSLQTDPVTIRPLRPSFPYPESTPIMEIVPPGRIASNDWGSVSTADFDNVVDSLAS